MEQITDFNQKPQENTIIVNPEQSFLKDKSFVNFGGTDNILFVEDGTILASNTQIRFQGNDALVYLRKGKRELQLKVLISTNCCLFIDEGISSPPNNKILIKIYEHKNVIIGSDCMFSEEITIRNSDTHLLYDSNTGLRLNESTSIYIGDHVWVGIKSSIFRGSTIGSGSIIGSNALVQGKQIPSNTSFAGVPAKLIRSDIFWSREFVKNWDENKTIKYKKSATDKFIYSDDGNVINITELDCELCDLQSASEKLKFIENKLVNNRAHNRFYIGKSPIEQTKPCS